MAQAYKSCATLQHFVQVKAESARRMSSNATDRTFAFPSVGSVIRTQTAAISRTKSTAVCLTLQRRILSSARRAFRAVKNLHFSVVYEVLNLITDSELATFCPMRLFGEIGDATLEGARSKPQWAGVAVKISRKIFLMPGNYSCVTDFTYAASFSIHCDT